MKLLTSGFKIACGEFFSEFGEGACGDVFAG